MVKPTSPTAAVTQAMKGKRTGITIGNKGDIPVGENGMEDPETFWKTAKTPKEKPEQPEQEDDEEEEKAAQRLKDKNAAEKPKTKPRFSLEGQEVEEGKEAADADDKAAHILSRVATGAQQLSPSEMSRVSTAPPTPTSVVTQQPKLPATQVNEEEEDEGVPFSPPEGVRASPDEELEEAVAAQGSSKSPSTVAVLPTANEKPDDDDEEEETFPVDDEDDMIPPPPPDAEDADISVQEEPQTQDEVEFPADVNDDDDDDDKEGSGFVIVHDPDTPESVREERLKEEQKQKKKAKRKKKDASDSEAPEKKPKGKRPKKKVTYASSPMGYPAGNREYEIVPVSDFKDYPEDDGLRRSRRAKVKPLEFWKNERPVYEAHHETGILGEAMGLMPVISGYVSAQPTPYKKRKAPAAPANKGKKAKKSSTSASVATYEEETPFDSRKLRKKYKFIDGEEASVWDEVADDITDQKVVSYADRMVATDLPLPKTRKKSEGKVVGKASQAFNVPTDEDDRYVGYIMGSLTLPPTGIKDPESSGACSLSFTVCQGQPKSIEIAFGDPSEQDGELNLKTAQRFLLSPGDMFRVLPGNCYRLQNHSKTTECLLSWTIIRPRRNQD